MEEDITKNNESHIIQVSDLKILTFFSVAYQRLNGQGLLITENSLSHSDTPHSIGLLWTSDQLVTETCI